MSLVRQTEPVTLDDREASGAADVARLVYRDGHVTEGSRVVPEETAVAFVYDGTAHAVMMATPCDLDDFALGFSLTEGIVAVPAEIEQCEVIAEPVGIELRMRLAEKPAAVFKARRRVLTGPAGCGLCGIESLDEAMRSLPTVRSDTTVTPSAVFAALRAVGEGQALNRATHAVHAAAFCARDGALVALREDIGRHNAVDKLAGAMARAGVDVAGGMMVLTSRVSIELVQKAAMIGIAIIVAVSAPTALAIHTAETAGITLIAVARSDGFEVFTHPGRMAQ